MGRPMPGVPVVLVDPLTGEPADEGEICLDLSQSPLNLMTGYLGDPERNAAVMAGGYYHTGDVASRDEDGYITYIGRTDDVFKSSDYKVSPFELESVLIEHPAVVEAAVVPQPDDTRLAVPKAYITLAEGWTAGVDTARAILEHARDNLAPYLKVRRVEFFELPKTVSGKIRRVELRRREEDAHAAGTRIESEYRYEDLVDAPLPSYDAGPTDTPILEETDRRQLRADRGDPPRYRGPGRRRGRPALDLRRAGRRNRRRRKGIDGPGHREGRPRRDLGAELCASGPSCSTRPPRSARSWSTSTPPTARTNSAMCSTSRVRAR